MDLVIRRRSEQFQAKFENTSSNVFYDRKWEWGFLRKQCRNLELEQFYVTYTQRLQRSYLSIFIVVQAVVGITHSVLLLAAAKDTLKIFPEVLGYLTSILIVWASLFITFREDFIKRRQWVAYIASFVAIITLVLADLLVPLYQATVNYPRPALRPAYGSYILYAVYIFIPITENLHAFLLGMAVTACYLIEFVMVTYRLDNDIVLKTITEAIFFLCINFFGNYFRYMKEIDIRTTFLDRRECVEENLLLRYARDQEQSLLLSILPAHTAERLEKDIREMIEKIKEEKARLDYATIIPKNDEYLNGGTVKKWRRQPATKLYVEEHNEVSVLYADVVNYTYMTTQLDVKPLVETLHELFVKFDQASEEYNVLRIKFLGDCYYCVSGVPNPNDHHAKSCVDLGLRMIRDIREVRNRRKLDIDMRIGVHSGSIISGVIGACKWQYDIWSRDVDIANRLEQTGEAGRVHITGQTLALLDGAYMYEEGTQKAKEDEVLIKYGIKTYLIKSHPYIERCYSEEGHRQSVGVKRKLEMGKRKTPIDVGTHKNFMQNTIEQYNQIRTQTKLEMSRELDKMPIGKFHLNKLCLGTPKRLTQDELEEQNFRSNVSTLFLFFKNWQWELLFLVEPDVMLKYSSLIGLATFLGIFAMQSINVFEGRFFWVVNALVGVFLMLFIPLTWFKKLWIIFNPPTEDDVDDCGFPRNRFLRFLYEASHRIMRSILSRTVIYLTIVATLCVTTLLHLIECERFNEPDHSNEELFTPTNATTEAYPVLCFNSWAITESLVLTIAMSFLFVRIPFLFKFLVGFVIVAVYSWLVFDKYPYVYDLSASTNLGLEAKYAHIFTILITFGIFHLVDRQTEYLAKVDYNWKRQLQKKQEDAEFTNETIKVLVQNILPGHVADIYMSRKMKDELYYEKYDNVAIMFATIKNYDMEQVGLSVLNRIICDFDEVLMSHTGPLKIEKIKVAGWTYMVACGLDPGRCDSTTSLTGFRNTTTQRSSALLPTGRRSMHNGLSVRNKRLSLNLTPTVNKPESERIRKQSSRQSHNVVYVLTEFALELMKALQTFNRENFQFENVRGEKNHNGMLRVGISHGEIMAGVVGSSKPLYDVWGNAVNMASRMDSTGIPGKIQITEETAEVLKGFGISCDYRGLTYVKGKDYIPTYFVGIDDNFNFIRETPPSTAGIQEFGKNDILLSTRL
ncbi:adenylyl cyclase X E isoform X2 [Hermetia illucens]|uniref:adenylyl cyclase X E isoform X2 n=1 Tax=Hermetia illucens TaxID=343691 RepID=UPI0018CC4F57|nr:adenylyl cyclase X E isoform X2 [Hermetia illucens]